MASFNRVILMGNLTRDPQVRYIPSGTAVADLGLAVSRQWFDKQSNTRKEETTFVDVVLWARTAEVAGEYLSKGSPVLIEGRLQLDQWDDKETGQKRSKLRVVGEYMQMLGSKGGGGGGGGGGAAGGGGANRGAPRPQQADEQGPGSADDYYSDAPSGGIPDDEVPF